MKKFYNNTLIGGAFSKALRVIALLCVLLGVSNTAFGAYVISVYKNDGSGAKNTEFVATGNGTQQKATFTIDNYTGYTHDYKFWIGNGGWENNKSENRTLSDYISSCSSGTMSICIWTDSGDMNYYPHDGKCEENTPSYGFFDNNAWNIKVGDNWSNDDGYGATGNTTINLGTVSAGASLGFWAQTWKDNTSICAPKVAIKIEGVDNNYVLKDLEWNKNLTDDERDQLWQKDNVGYTLPITPGKYTMRVYFQFVAKENENCVAKDMYLNNGGGNFELTFTVAGGGGGGDEGDCTTLYLEPTGNWNYDGARFAAYFFGGGEDKWVSMESCSSICDGLFKVGAPNSSWTNVIFCRMNGSTTENNWDNKWDQTQNLSRQTSGNNLFTITNKPEGQNWTGDWKTSSCTDKASCSGGGSGGGDTGDDDDPLEDCNVVEIWARGQGMYTDIYCNVSNANAEYTDIKSYKGANYATWKVTTSTSISVQFCAGDNHGYCTNSSAMEPGNRYICEFVADNWGDKNYTVLETKPLDCQGEPTDVLLSKEAKLNKTDMKATLYGYLKNNKGCYPITEYGFVYCRVLDGEKCTPNANSEKLTVSPADPLVRGTEFEAELPIEDGFTYYYRAYAVINGATILSQEKRMIGTDPCVQQTCCGAPVVYTINADPTFVPNQCKLHFNSLQDAIDHLKASSFRTDAYGYAEYDVKGSYNLKQPVVMNVVYYDDTPDDNTSAYIYRGTTNVGKRAGDATPKNSNLIQDINRTATNDANTLTIKAGTKVAKPWIHHIVLRNSRNIVLDSLCIYSDPVDYDQNTAGVQTIGDNAIEMDINHADASDLWNELNNVSGVGLDDDSFLSNANILVQNCMIGSDGFTGAHISSYDGVTFKNNDFEIQAGANIDKNYGASFKLLYCKNVKFIENNFRGDHATLMWIQEVQNMLVMNNVFWNTNKYTVNEGDQYPAAMRLVTQFSNPIKNVGFFYNTYYFDSNDVTSSVSGYDFLQMTHTISGGSGDIDIANSIKFQYNNCYSYDADAPGRTPDNKNYKYYGWKDGNYVVVADYTGPFLGYNLASNENFCPNNFWSQYDQDIYDDLTDQNKANYVSKFAFGCTDNKFINVKGEVCETTASGPASLIVKSENLNKGKKPNISFTGIGLNNEEWYSDRYLTEVRPSSNEKWTYGAYQSKKPITTNTIYWVGVTDDWDDRNNWEYEVKDASGAIVRQRVSCINSFSSDLKAVIEEIGTVEVAGGRKWPKVPASFNAEDRKANSTAKVPVNEQVSVGNVYASTIELEYGAGIKGVENLQGADGTLRYNRAITHFDILASDRNKWLLVGPVVRPFESGSSGSTRDVNSGDYFKNFEPHIYMHEITDDGENISWGKTFGDTNIPVYPNTVFALQASKDYGPYFDTAEDYLKYEGIQVSDKDPVSFVFTGRFAVEENKEGNNYKYTSLKDGKNLLNNVYPCNLNAKKIESSNLGTVNVYNYQNGSFESSNATSLEGNVFIKSQNGFIFTPKSGNSLEITPDLLVEGSTRTRAAELTQPTFSLNVDNANTTAPGASNVVIRYDEFLGNEVSDLNTPKVFTKNVNTPEAYIINQDSKYTRLLTGKEKITIPLGIRLQKPMNLTFEKVYNEGYDEVVLVDTKTQKFYNLLKRSYTTDALSAGDTEGRFYLNLTVSGDEDLEEEGDNNTEGGEIEGGDVSTDVEETIEEADINIYSVDNSIVRVIATGTTLKAIYVNDMTGRTDKYIVDGNFVELQLPVSSGVYTVTVIGETASKTGKVILK